MISMVQPLRAGNALRLYIDPPAGAKYWRVLKMGSDAFGGPDDLDSAIVTYEGDDRVIVDADKDSLPNEQMMFYRPFYRMSDDTWQAGPTATGTPAAIYEEVSTDAQSFLRERIEAGLYVECQRGTFATERGYVQVYTAPPSLEQNLLFPLVTISLEDASPGERAIGEDIAGDEFDAAEGEWFDSEGWLEDTRISIVGWSLNSDERIELRKALRRVIVANLPILASRGIEQVNLSMQDVDALNGEYGAPMYQVMATLSCIAPVRVGRTYGAGQIITDIDVRSTNG